MSDGLDPRVNLISRQPGGKWRAIETDCGAMTLHAEADSLAELLADPDTITLPIEQYGALVREREQAIREHERVRDALELAKQGDAGAIAKAAKREAQAPPLPASPARKPSKAVERMLKSQIEWLTLEREISRLRRLRCTEAAKPDYRIGDNGQEPCWLSGCDVADMCAPCQQRVSNIDTLRKQRSNARRRMVYAFKAYTKAGASISR